MADHFSEDDARRIFARAAERQGTGDAPETGLSLEELEAIGQASGIDPAHIAAAATELRAGVGTPPSTTAFGVPRTVEAVRVLPGPVTDDAWARIVDDLRTTFNTFGVLTEIGQTREWADGRHSGRDGVRLTVRPRPGGAEIIARHSLDASAHSVKVLGGVGLVAVAMMAGIAFISGDAAFVGFSVAVTLLVAAVLCLTVWSLRRSARHAEGEFGALLERAERAVAQTTEATPRTTERAAPRIDLPDTDALELDDTPSPRRRRRRTR